MHFNVAWRWSRLTRDSSYLPLEKSPNKTGDMCPETDPDEVEGVQFASMCLLDETVRGLVVSPETVSAKLWELWVHSSWVFVVLKELYFSVAIGLLIRIY